jgi:hypothetical protein
VWGRTLFKGFSPTCAVSAQDALSAFPAGKAEKLDSFIHRRRIMSRKYLRSSASTVDYFFSGHRFIRDKSVEKSKVFVAHYMYIIFKELNCYVSSNHISAGVKSIVP